MSTRSNVLITYGQTRVFVYRHCDGYLEGGGRTLLDCLQGLDRVSRPVDDLLKRLFSMGDSYEVTNNWHGDIEFAYHVDFDTHKYPIDIRVGVAQVSWGTKDPEPKLGTLDDFRKAVELEEGVAGGICLWARWPQPNDAVGSK